MRAKSRLLTGLFLIAGAVLVLSAGPIGAQTLAERYPPRVEDLRPTSGWAPQFRRPEAAAVLERVPLRVDWGENEVAESAVTFGVPFPRGALADAGNARIVDAAGQAAPAELRVTATWDGPGGPVRWALAHARLRRGGEYFLEYGTDVKAPAFTGLRVTESAGRVVIDTGPMRVSLSRQVPSLVESVTLTPGGELVAAARSGSELPVVVDGAGNRYRAGGSGEGLAVKVVEAGPMRAAVRREGWYLDDAGNRFCQFVTHTYFYAGEAGLRHDHTLVVAFDTNRHQVRDIMLPVPVETGAGAQAVFATEGTPGGAPVELPASGGPWSLVQANHDRWKLSGPNGSPASGARAGGWYGLAGAAGGVFAGISDFWQQYPAQLEAGGNILRLHLWPDRGVDALDFRPSVQLGDQYPGNHVFSGRWYRDGLDEMTQGFGLGKTHSIHLDFFAAGGRDEAWRRTRAQAVEPVLALPDPAWVCAGEVLYGRVHPYDPDRFPEIEALLDDIVDFYYRQREDNKQYGWIHFGDVYNTGALWRRWASMFYGFPNLMPRLYLRSGRRDAWDFHRVNARHITDIDICHLDSAEFGKWRGGRYGGDGCIVHYAADQYGVGPDTHVEFMLMDYYLNGNLRTREVADYYLRAHAARRDAWALTSYQHRSTGGALRLFAEAYQATWEPEYLSIMRQAADLLYQAHAELGVLRRDDVYMNPGMILYYQLTGEKRMRDLFLANMTDLAQKRNVHVLADTRSATLSGLAHAYWFTGDEQFLPFLHWQMNLPLARGIHGVPGLRIAINATHGYQFPDVMALLAEVDQLPDPLGPAAPEIVAHDLALKSNGAFYLRQEADGEFSVTVDVNLYEARAGNFPGRLEWLDRLPAAEQPALLVLGPEGGEIRRVELTPENTARPLKLSFPADGMTGTYAFVPVSPAAPVSARLAQSTLEKRVLNAGENWLSGNINRLLQQRSYFFTVPAGTGEFTLELKTAVSRGPVNYGVTNQVGALVAENDWETGSDPRNDWEVVKLDAGDPDRDETWCVTFNTAGQVYLRFTGVPGYVASTPEALFTPGPARRRDLPAVEIPAGEEALRYAEAGLPWGGRAACPAESVAITGGEQLFDERQGTVEMWLMTTDSPANLANRPLLGCGSFRLYRRYNVGTYATLGGTFQRFFILPPGRWTYLALTWQPSAEPGADLDIRLFADGVEVTSTDIGGGGTPHRKVEAGWSGRQLTVPAGNFVSNLRVSGVVRYRENFARPEAPFEPDADTRVLCRFDGDGRAWVLGDWVPLR